LRLHYDDPAPTREQITWLENSLTVDPKAKTQPGLTLVEKLLLLPE